MSRRKAEPVVANPIVTCPACGRGYSQVEWEKLYRLITIYRALKTTAPRVHIETRKCRCGNLLDMDLVRP